ncbi:unnamed protein product [Cladocopium goreaui]|uniref:Uncharacterized protein n=1 Tax=Cladocopium goreaui TaxID=2562237 RepID=A0A9P1DCX0_9DINO|nr:unnamed protein product [Cladocopium goreaui]
MLDIGNYLHILNHLGPWQTWGVDTWPIVAGGILHSGGEESFCPAARARAGCCDSAPPATDLRCHAARERLQAQGEASADPGRWSFWGRTKVLSVPSSPSLAALETPAVEDEMLEGQSGTYEAVQREDVEREDLAFKYRPSVGSWLMPRPCRIPWPDA